MDTTLVTVTLMSMAMAASLSVIVWRMLRDERRRSDARVIALTTMAAHHQGPRTNDRGTRDLVLRELPARSAALFAEPEHTSPWGHRFAVMAGLALVLASAILFLLTANGRAARPAAAQGRISAGGAQPAANPTGPGLELLSLRDTRQTGSLMITGLVRNAHGADAMSRVTVTAYVFDDNGAFLASGRAPIDVTALAPGDESPFVVSVPVTETVARYRIGFRTDDGRVIAHIDKRPQTSVAAR